MATLLGTACSWKTLGCQGSAPEFPSAALMPPSLKKSQRSSFFGGGCSSSVTAAASAPSRTRLSSGITAAALLEQQEGSKRAAYVKTTAREAASNASGMSPVTDGVGDAEETSTSYSTRVAADLKAWKATRNARKTSRRRALALCLALAGLSPHGPSPSGLARDQASDSQARDLIRVSQSTDAEVSAPMVSPVSGERYGDLVTVSTGSDSSNDRKVKGLPSWMGGNYHLCMGDGFHVQLPSDWHMRDTQGRLYGTVLRYEDKADPSTNVVVLKNPTSQSRTGNLGNPEDWIRGQVYLLSEQDEGTDGPQRFTRGNVSIAKVLSVDKPYKQGLTYYNYEILTKQGGEQANALHELVSAVVNNGNLYMCRVQTGEGRWQEDSQSVAQRIVDSFQITGFKVQV